jgi:hypothetical protein
MSNFPPRGVLSPHPSLPRKQGRVFHAVPRSLPRLRGREGVGAAVGAVISLVGAVK